MARLAGWPANTKPAMKTKGNARVLEFRDNDSSSTRAARRPSPPFQVIKKNFPYFSPIIVVKQKKKKKPAILLRNALLRLMNTALPQATFIL